MRPVAVLLIVLLASCGTRVQESPTTASIQGAPSVEASSAGSASSGPLAARPLDSMAGAPLGYLEYLPPGYGDGEPRPLLVFLHGAGEAGIGSEETLELVDDLGIPQLIADAEWPDSQPFVVLSPQYGSGPASGDCAIADDVAAFLDFAIDRYAVDPARVYLTGISCGAIGIWDYLATYGNEMVAGAVPISGHAMWALEKAGCEPLAAVPVWAFHGARDDIIPVSYVEDQRDQIRACAGADTVEMELTVYPDGDHFTAFTATYDLSAGHDIYEWMLARSNASAP